MNFALTVPADPQSVRLVREALLHWLRGAGWPEEERDPLVFAVSEAVSNSIEHAYATCDGEVTVEAHEESGESRRQIIVTVTDRGIWRPAPPEDEGRRRGIPLMHAFAETVEIERSAGGTTVSIASRLTPSDRRAGHVANQGQ
jgi:anti-sigma regulatory factor (Ser/Thr protein kinase)